MSRRILITGARGFAGSHLVRAIVQNTDWDIISLERLSNKTSSVLPDRLTNIPQNRISCFYHDFRAPLQDNLLADIGQVDYIVHNGAEVHAVRSLTDPRSFVQSNTIGTFHMLDAARKIGVRKFLFTSSAEVFGSVASGEFHNDDSPLNPSNPYSAAKAGAEMLCHSYFKSFGVPVNIARTMNMFGPTQDVTKFVPMVIKKALMGETLKVHVRGNEVGSRQWIPIFKYINALLFILENGIPDEAYNVSGVTSSNLDVVNSINENLPAPVKYELVEAPATHDMRYAIRGQKLCELGWSWGDNIDYLAFTVKWYLKHSEWLCQ